jgi:hypothetical protein
LGCRCLGLRVVMFALGVIPLCILQAGRDTPMLREGVAMRPAGGLTLCKGEDRGCQEAQGHLYHLQVHGAAAGAEQWNAGLRAAAQDSVRVWYAKRESNKMRTTERRQRRRYEVSLAVRYHAFGARGKSKWRTGTTCDLSATGLTLLCHQRLETNTRIQMVIDWPEKQDNVWPICLKARGHVVRCQGSTVAVQMTSCRMVIENWTAPMAASTPSM